MVVTRRASALNTGQQQKDDHLFADLDHAHRRRGCFSCRNLGCAFLFAILLGVVGIFGVVAETGLVTVPVLSSALYQQPPKPIRAVEPEGESSFETLVAGKLKDIAASAGGGKVQLSLTEAELTKLAQEPRLDGQVPIKQAQITIEPAFVELYGLIKLPNGEQGAVIRIKLSPDATKPQLNLTEIRIGYVRVPLPVAKIILRMATGIASPDSLSGAQFGIQSVSLTRGVVTLTADESILTSKVDSE